MPLIRCPRCDRAYDVPGVIAVRLPGSIAPCACGEWLSGSKAAILARTVDVEQIREIDMAPYLVETPPAPQDDEVSEPLPPTQARSVRIVARGTASPVDRIFTIRDHPLWIGRLGSHVEIRDAELSIRHCSISVEGDRLVVRDAHSHHGTFLDGHEIEEAAIGDGVHLLRTGSALISVEPTAQAGTPVEPIALDEATLGADALMSLRHRAASTTQTAAAARVVLICLEGSLAGQEFEVPESGLVVGREGHVRVPDEFLSRRHFEVTRDAEGAVRVRDLGSRNGTFLNTLPARNTRVHAGDEIRAGVNRFRIEQRS
jgi:pSer/pThr/pTyr-binding forkhead associated (FHA) protein